jgi:hypothetical protein
MHVLGQGSFCKNTQGEEQAGRWYFANWHHLPREPLDGDQTVGVSTPQPTKGSTRGRRLWPH